MQIVKGILLAVLVCILTWRVLVIGFAEHYLLNDTEPAIAKSLNWYSGFAPALFEKAVYLEDGNANEAETFLVDSLAGDPTNALAYTALAELWQEQDREADAAKLMNTASELAPRRVPVQLAAGAFWLRQNELDFALKHWDVALTMRPSVRNQLYPVLLDVLTTPQASETFASILQELPSWWPSFFGYAARNAKNLDTLRLLYRFRVSNEQPLGRDERRYYLTRLQQEGQWLEAYFVWLNSLDKQQTQALGNLHNGSFEVPLSDEDFGWRTPKVNNVLVSTSTTAGARGEKALRVVFQDRPVRFQHLYQRLVLNPGRYRLQGLLKLDSLRATQGLQWHLKCYSDQRKAMLGSSERFLGSAPWQPFFFEFEIPAKDCSAQELKLVLVGRSAQDFQVKGIAWFDGMTIRKKN